MELPEPVHNFVEIVKVGRDYHWYSDVTLYYKSEARSKLTFSFQLWALDRWIFLIVINPALVLSLVLEFKVEGGCKLKENAMADYHQVTITMPNGRHIFQVTRFKAGGKMYAISFATNSVKIALMFPFLFWSIPSHWRILGVWTQANWFVKGGRVIQLNIVVW